MRDRIAMWFYLSLTRKGLIHFLAKWGWRLRIRPRLFPRIWAHGGRVWSTKMFDEQLRRDGLL